MALLAPEVIVSVFMPRSDSRPLISINVPMVTPIDPVQQFLLAMILSHGAEI